MNRTTAIALLAGLALLVTTSDASAGRKGRNKAPAPACGLTYLNLVKGTTWVYEYYAPEDMPERKGLFLEDPVEVTITVLDVETSGRKGSEGKVTLEEKHRKFTRTTVITCNADGAQISPHSFLFAGDVGGGIGIELENLTREGVSFPAPSEFRTGTELIETMKADAKRIPSEGTGVKHAAAKVEVEREIKFLEKEDIDTGVGPQKAFRLDVSVTGRASVAPELDKMVNMPQARSAMWFASGVGLVQAINRLGQGWRLKSMTQAEAEQP